MATSVDVVEYPQPNFVPSGTTSPYLGAGEDWGWTFNDTTVVHAIDITGVVESPPVWNNVVFWMYMMFISGVVLILYSTYVSKAEAAKKAEEANTKCQVCQMEMMGEPVICPNCNARMHVSCLDQGRFCPKCRGMIISPPPPVVPMPIQQQLIEIAKQRYPNMELYRALQSNSSFSLEFEKIE